MKLLSLPQAPTRQQAMFFRNSYLGPVIISCFFLLFAILMIYQYAIGKMPLMLMVVFAAGALLFMMIVTTILLRSLKSTNWLLALGPDRLWIKYRSYLNSHFPPEDLQIIELRYDAIEFVGLIRRKEILPGQKNGTVTKYSKHLDFVLRQSFDDVLPEALLSERNARAPQRKGIRSKSLDYPVRDKEGRIVRVRISGCRPGWKAALQELARNGVALSPDQRETEDYTLSVEDRRQIDDRLIQLVEQGNTIAAVKLACRHYDMGLAEAREFVHELGHR